ncbi:MAG: hypothetical protein ACREH9_10600, partial [Pseudomonadota bacterium]
MDRALPTVAAGFANAGRATLNSAVDQRRRVGAVMAARQLHLGAFMRPVGIHTAWWRYPGAYPDANFDLGHLIRFA